MSYKIKSTALGAILKTDELPMSNGKVVLTNEQLNTLKTELKLFENELEFINDNHVVKNNSSGRISNTQDTELDNGVDWDVINNLQHNKELDAAFDDTKMY